MKPVGGKKKENSNNKKRYDYEDNERNPNDCCPVRERGNDRVQQEGIHRQVQESHLQVYRQIPGVLPVPDGHVCRPEADEGLALKPADSVSYKRRRLR